jgi:DNA topoisomerase VI subunit B
VEAKPRILQMALSFVVLNPHISLRLGLFGESQAWEACETGWQKWRSNEPTSPHWYTPAHLKRLMGAYIAHDSGSGRERTVREFVSEFRGLSGTAKQKAVLEVTGFGRSTLKALVNGHDIDDSKVTELLAAMCAQSIKVKPQALGIIGKPHLSKRFEALGCEQESFTYVCKKEETDGVPWVIETAFAWCPDATERRLVTGVNFSPGIINPFRELGSLGMSMDAVLQEQRVGRHEPVILMLHMACPRVSYADRGKSAVVMGG